MTNKVGIKIEADFLAEIARQSINQFPDKTGLAINDDKAACNVAMNDNEVACCSKTLENNDDTFTVDTKNRTQKPKKSKTLKCKTVKCPFCGIEQTNLKGHAMRKHGLTEENALGLKSQYNLHKKRALKRDEDRVTKRRKIVRRVCPLTGCSKAPVRLDNHLRATHGIEDDIYFNRLMRKAKPVEQYRETSEESSAAESESEPESEYLTFKKIISGEKSYLEKFENGDPIDSEDSEDDDWLVEYTHRWANKKEERQKKRVNDDKHLAGLHDPLRSNDDTEVRESLNQIDKIERQKRIADAPSDLDITLSDFSDDDDEEEENNDDKIKKKRQKRIADAPSDLDIILSDSSDDDKEENNDDKIEKNSTEDEIDDAFFEDDEDVDYDAKLVMVPWKKSVFDEFKSWLQSPDGGGKKKRQAEQHASQTIVILKGSSEGSFEYKFLFDRKAIRDKWLNNFDNNRAAGTVKSYLYSLRFFYKYIETDHPKSLVQFEHRCTEMKNIMDSWISHYRKKQKERQWVNELKQLEEMITAADLKAFDASSQVLESKAILKSAIRRENVSMKAFVSARDYLLTSMCLDNASRTGALANMTLQEFKNGKIQDDTYIVNVVDHKTLDTSGPANIVLELNLYKESKYYLKYFRNSLEDIERKKTSPFFVSWNGNKMSSSMVTGQIKSYWGKSVGHTEKKPTFHGTKVRKYAVTKTYEEKPEMKKDLAMLMLHTEKTAAKSYFLQEKNKNAAVTSKKLHDLMRSVNVDENEAEEEVIKKHFSNCFETGKVTLSIIRSSRENLKCCTDLTDIQLRNKVIYMMQKATKATKAEFSSSDSGTESECSEKSLDDKETFDSPTDSKRQRAEFSTSENDLIEKFFNKLIQGTGTIRKGHIKNKCNSIPELNELLEKFGDYKLTEKIRSERKKFIKNNQ
ncbi:uncharacterized protein [Clytia hemisphaerica]